MEVPADLLHFRPDPFRSRPRSSVSSDYPKALLSPIETKPPDFVILQNLPFVRLQSGRATIRRPATRPLTMRQLLKK